jgi:hypothetical protein
MLKSTRCTLKTIKETLLRLTLVILIWKLKEITQDVEKILEQDTVVIIQGLDGKLDIGLVKPGQQNQYPKWFNMNPFTLTKSKILEIVNEYSFNGKFEGDTVIVSSFRMKTLPKAIMVNVLRSISEATGTRATYIKYTKGIYDNVEIRLFGQLLTYLSNNW